MSSVKRRLSRLLAELGTHPIGKVAIAEHWGLISKGNGRDCKTNFWKKIFLKKRSYVRLVEEDIPEAEIARPAFDPKPQAIHAVLAGRDSFRGYRRRDVWINKLKYDREWASVAATAARPAWSLGRQLLPCRARFEGYRLLALMRMIARQKLRRDVG